MTARLPRDFGPSRTRHHEPRIDATLQIRRMSS